MALGARLRAAVAAIQREGGAGGDRIGAAGMLLPQVAPDNIIKSGVGWRHTRLELLSNGWSLGGEGKQVLVSLEDETGFTWENYGSPGQRVRGPTSVLVIVVSARWVWVPLGGPLGRTISGQSIANLACAARGIQYRKWTVNGRR